MTPPTDRKGLERLIAHAIDPDACDEEWMLGCMEGKDCECRAHVRRLLTAIEAAGVRLMPAEATEVQIGAAYSREIKDDVRAYVGIYRAMRDASPYAEKTGD